MLNQVLEVSSGSVEFSDVQITESEWLVSQISRALLIFVV